MLIIEQQLQALSESTKEILKHYRFDEQRLIRQAEQLRAGRPFENKVSGVITAPEPGDIAELPGPASAEYRELERLGEELLGEGRCALVVLAGGMATRMGGVVKALVEAVPGKTFLELRLQAQRTEQQRYGKAVPLWLMTSYATEEPIREALGSAVDGWQVAVFAQHLSVRLKPDGALLLDEHAQPSLYAPGHGDLPDALRESELLSRFVRAGGRVIMVTNLDNVGGTVDPVLLGFHVKHGASVTVEVVDKLASDRGGIPVRVDNKLRVLEELRIPDTFDPATVRVFNTNVFQFDARALLELDMKWLYYKVEKVIDDHEVIQFERILNEVTAELPTRYLRVERTGVRSRFLPCKDLDELAARQRDIELVARTRGML